MQADHFCIVVPLLDAAIAPYGDVLNCEVTASAVREGQDIKEAFVCLQSMQVSASRIR